MSLFTEYLIFSRTLPPRRRVFSATMVIYSFTLFLGDFIGLWVSNVIPSTTGAHLGAIFGSFNGLAWVILLERNLRNHTLSHTPAIRAVRDSSALARFWSRGPIMLCVGFLVGYMAVAWGYPWLYNKAFATVVTKTVNVTGWERGGGRNCSRPAIGYNTFVLAPHALCVRSDAQVRMPVGSSIRLVGPESVLGMNVQQIYSTRP